MEGGKELAHIALLLACVGAQCYAAHLLWPHLPPGVWTVPHWPWWLIGVIAAELVAAAVWFDRWDRRHGPTSRRRH